jgi:3-phenylpropionate/trans-cinnamate dioxygenase ferredoxin reductase subunit
MARSWSVSGDEGCAVSGRTMTRPRRVVIVGAGQAGYWVARTLRDRDFVGEIVLVGDERHPPYERPPLSKEIVRGIKAAEDTYLTTPAALTERAITAMLGTTVTAINRAAATVSLEDGSALPYDDLVIATGGRGRRLALPGADPDRLLYLRTIEDAHAIAATFRREQPLLVVGGGWIGLEAAAVARSVNVPVTVIETSSQLCPRALPAAAAGYLRDLHTRHCVDVRLGCTVTEVRGDRALLSTGAEVACGEILMGVGMIPNAELAIAAGLDTNDGILVGEGMRTSDPAIFAVGDVARYHSARHGRMMRLESWSNAQDSGISAARAILGEACPYDPLPWFWSDQYDVNLQLVGLPGSHHDVIVRGAREADAFSLIYIEGEHIVAALSVNQPRENRIIRKLIEGRKIIERSYLADSAVNLQHILRAA